MVATLTIGGRWLAGESHIVRRPYDKPKSKFSSCGRVRTLPCAVAMKLANLPLPGRVLMVG